MKNIKFISCAILVFFTTCILSIPAFAISGTGTEADPYLVSTPSDIALMHNDLDGYYKLTADIDMAGVEFEPIGNESEGAFAGTVDGDGHTISNLDINLPENKYVGFVGCLEGTIKNLNLKNVDACGYKYVGGIAGYMQLESLIDKCTVDGKIGGKYLISNVYAGGIIGYSCDSKVINCKNYAYANGQGTSNDKAYSGGIIGYGVSSIISGCENFGDISSSRVAGGIIGYGSGENTSNCINYGNISAQGYYSYLGGICGVSTGNITFCINYGYISCDRNDSTYLLDLGGVCGDGSYIANCINYGGIKYRYASTMCVGGIAGSGNVSQCVNFNHDIRDYSEHYSIGGISSSGSISDCISYGSGIAGWTNYAYIGTSHSIKLRDSLNISHKDAVYGNNSYNEISNVYGIKELNSSNALQRLNYADFNKADCFDLNFETTWYIDPNINSGFPYLKNLPKHMVLNESILLLNVGETKELIAFFEETKTNVTWESADETVVTISEEGLLTAISTGETSIIATNAEGMIANCFVCITKVTNGISLNKAEYEIKAGSKETLTYTLNPVDANEVVVWASSNEAVATVDQSGVVTAKTKGTAIITVTTVTSYKSASCEVTVVGAPITSVSITSSATVNKGTPYKLSLSISPSQYAGTVTWHSSDETVATVSQDGTVTGLKAGSAIISVKSDTGYTDTCTVTVKIPSTTITLNKAALTLETGTTEKLVANLTPADSTDTVSWSSSNSSYASVASDGTVTAKSAYSGTITITATTTSGLKAYCMVKVIAAKVPVSSVTLDSTEIIMTKADTKQLKATVLPDNATDKNLVWTSSDESVAMVSNTGVVTATGNGVATITATANNGTYCEGVVKVISASGPSIIIGDVKASPADTPTVNVNIVKNPGISGYKFTINYDDTLMTPISVTANKDFGGTLTTNLDDENRTEFNVVWYSNGDTDIDINGELFSIDFKVSDTAEPGDYSDISIEYGAKDICNTAGENIALYTKSAKVSVEEPLPGDICEDGEVNIYDLTLLARYITGLEKFTARQIEAANVTDDEFVDIKDVVKLSQFLVGWSNVELLSISESAKNEADIDIGNITADLNGEVEIPVYIKNNSGIAGFSYSFEYDMEKLQILSVDPGSMLETGELLTNLENITKDNLIVTWYQENDVSYDGILFTIKAKLAENCTSADISIKQADNNMCDKNTDYVIGKYTNGTVTSIKSILNFNGAQIRTTGVQGLRFIVSVTKDESIKDFGTVVMPKKYLGDNILVKDFENIVNGKVYKAKTVPAIRIFDETDTDIYYTVCITKIPPNKYSDEYVAVPYVTYADGTTKYGEMIENINVYSVAELAYADDKTDETAKQYLYDNILSVVDPEKYPK